MSEIYLGFWKNLSYLEMTERAAIILALKSIPLFGIILLLLLFRRGLVDFFYLVINGINERISSRKSFEDRADSSNRIAKSYEKMRRKMNHMHVKRWILAVLAILSVRYSVLLAAIGYSAQVTDTMGQSYIGSLVLAVTEKYQNYESDKLLKAMEHQPLIPVDAPDAEELHGTEDAEPSTDDGIWLSLSKKGSKGTNVKKKPSKKSKKVAFVSGKDQVLFLSINKEGWVKVQLENGKKGWINKAFLKGVPD